MKTSLHYKLEQALMGGPPKTPARVDLKQRPPSLITLVDGVLDGDNERPHFFRPSMLFGCDRANVMHYLQAPLNPQRQDPRFKRILDNGTAIHSVMQGYLARHPDIWFAPEAKVALEIGGKLVRGSCDGVCIRRSDGYRWGIEIKTISHDQFDKLRKPKPEHVFQAGIYQVIQQLWWITIIYWDKDKQFLKEFPVEYNPEQHKEMRLRVKGLGKKVDTTAQGLIESKGWDRLDKRVLPVYDPSTCDTTFCGFSDYCSKKGGPKKW